ncbi:hypothetical protein Psta_3251 [Pirellula staleyi DSM 6068]|uniref:Uncharacterized protein n=1 Tax=Pirellula staleyi (strain ATCC 27377 / DSM 6068 / ICPB 4128) TaxID=530564 RepID=D2QX75_PIRSD|nr:hypothetical protein Psta_3251 [Pirellula staleyi DSM 6068]
MSFKSNFSPQNSIETFPPKRLPLRLTSMSCSLVTAHPLLAHLGVPPTS